MLPRGPIDLNLDVLPRGPLKLNFERASQRFDGLKFGRASQRSDGFEIWTYFPEVQWNWKVLFMPMCVGLLP